MGCRDTERTIKEFKFGCKKWMRKITNGIPTRFDCLVGNDIVKSNRSNPFDDIFAVTRAKGRTLATPTFNSNSKTDLSTVLTVSTNSKSNVQLVTDKVTDHLTNKVDTVIGSTVIIQLITLLIVQ